MKDEGCFELFFLIFSIVVNIGAIWPFYLPSAFPSLLIVSQWQSSCFTYAIQFFLLIILSFQTFLLLLQHHFVVTKTRQSIYGKDSLVC